MRVSGFLLLFFFCISVKKHLLVSEMRSVHPADLAKIVSVSFSV